MRCDVLAVGTELLLGQIIDSNSAWMGEQLAAHGMGTELRIRSAAELGVADSLSTPRRGDTHDPGNGNGG